MIISVRTFFFLTKFHNDKGKLTKTIYLDKQCQDAFDQGQFYEDIYYYFSQLYALIIKTLLVRYRRWGLLLAVFLLPIAFNILSNTISQSQSATGTFQMSSNLLNPQTVLYRTDSAMQDYFQSAIGSTSSDIKLEQRSDNISAMNEYIRRKTSQCCFFS